MKNVYRILACVSAIARINNICKYVVRLLLYEIRYLFEKPNKLPVTHLASDDHSLRYAHSW